MIDNKDNKISRRSFFKTSALLGISLLAAPKSVSQAATSNAVQPKTVQITKKRTLGSGAYSMEVSAIGLGCMGMNYNRSQSPNRQQCIDLIHEAVDRGITLFDTAIIYGPLINEELAGEALAPFKGKIAVTTKFGHEVIDGKATGRQDSRPETIKRYCDESLRRLKVDCIELFYQHRIDRNVPIEEVAGAIQDLIRAGKVKRWGLCEVNADTIRRAHAVHGVLDTCRQLGIGFVPYSPINRGFLGGNINEYTVFDPANDNRQTLPRFTPEAIRANTRIVNALQQFGRSRGMTSAQVALSWLLAKEPFIVPIPGTTKISHLEENIRATQMPLSASDITELENTLSSIPIVGDRYPAEQQRQVSY